MAILLGIASLCAILVTYFTIKLWRNYQVAKTLELPIMILPFDVFSLLWMIPGPFIRPWLGKLPGETMRDWTLLGDLQWSYPDRGRLHEKLGQDFVLVTPGKLNLCISDPGAVNDVIKRYNHFIKPPVIYDTLNFYGPNVDSANGELWKRHRRLTTAPFNERNSGLVWKETIKQATGMIEEWSGTVTFSGIDLASSFMKLALHVLTSAGFGKSYDYAKGTTVVPEGHTLSYRDTLAIILGDFFTALITHNVRAPMWMLPQKLRNMKDAQAEFKQYMVEMTEEQRQHVKSGKQTAQQDNLMSALIRANEMSQQEGKERYSLSDEEIHGNLFIWNMAGHDTTATTLTYAFTLLSVHPEIQYWVAEELKTVLHDSAPETWDYETIWPALPRCLAIMYETVRLYMAVPSMWKLVEEDQPLVIADKMHVVPNNTMITTNFVALHWSAKYWGNDVRVWKPKRFLDKDGKLSVPEHGAYLPWVTGPRQCPGKKFAQVEFVAVLAMCLRQYRIRAVSQNGENEVATKERVLAVIDDSEMGTNPVLKMKHPGKVKFSFERLS